MKRIAAMMVALAALTTFTTIASAHTPGLERRDARQRARIHQGIAGGRLTRHEAMRLRAGHRRIQRLERIARADGVVDRRERAMIRRAQLRESRAIFRLKHNGRWI